MAYKYSIIIRLGNSVKVTYDNRTGYWHMSDDNVTWKQLPANIKNAEAAIKRAATYYGLQDA